MKMVLSVVPSTALLITEGDVDDRVYQNPPILNTTVLLQQGTLTHKLIYFPLKSYLSIQIALPVPYGIRTGRPSNSISNASIHCLVILKATGSKFHHRLIDVVSCPFEEELKHNGQICTFEQDIESLSSRNRLIAGTAALPTTWLISVYIGESELETRVSVLFFF